LVCVFRKIEKGISDFWRNICPVYGKAFDGYSVIITIRANDITMSRCHRIFLYKAQEFLSRRRAILPAVWINEFFF
jgi:hypothetical protein